MSRNRRNAHQQLCESGPRADYNRHKRKRGSKVRMAVDTLGLLLAAHAVCAEDIELPEAKKGFILDRSCKVLNPL